MNKPIYLSRLEQFQKLFPSEKSFRQKQMVQALYNESFTGWSDVTSFSPAMREQMDKEIPWVAHEEVKIFKSAQGDTYKAILRLFDGKLIETVLMANRKGDWTICVSSQIGCAMDCQFCATGKMGLTRNLHSDEIMDQYRFWKYFLKKNPDIPQRISNVVFMGMGEPLGNYNNVKETINTWLKHTDMGPTYITVSTVGVLPVMEKMLTDPDWPHVRIAISLHSADKDTRKEIVPTSFENFLDKLQDWCLRYLEVLGNNRHYLTFEYVMLKDVNDTDHHAKLLADFINRLGHAKLNVIPYNFTDSVYQRSTDKQIQSFMDILRNKGVNVTRRKTMGDDIAAACGQLITEESKKSS